ncbi:trehalase [Stenotrophomonas panacihumi]|uniref:Putative periplasmic trehalase n=2 Tax=Stenotrophomonas panacihumi TaxID=676599 RepID=A0A0R0A8A7_9GAMM|nr:trehalase [Stenotrophomonas panacihumi]
MPTLFQAVQRGQVFDDQKTFPDLQPLQAPAQIEAAYLAQRGMPGFDLKAFVDARFRATPPPATPVLPADAPLAAHIDALWPLLSRDSRQVPDHGSQLPLPRPYVVPGGRFGEMYYWDSYFTMLGLHASGEGARARDMLVDFAHLIDTYGHIPNGTRSYYLSRSQPPFFSHMVELEADHEGPALRVRYLPQLRREYAYWMAGAQGLKPGQASQHVVRLEDGSVLNRYWDARDTPRTESYLQDVQTATAAKGRPAAEVYRDLRAAAESGWDFSSRWLGDRRQLQTIRTTAIVPVDLNSLLYHLETTIAVACEQAADAVCSRDFRAHAGARRQAMAAHLWNPAGFWADYDWRQRKISDQPTAAMLFPLYAGLSNDEQARQTARTAQAELLTPGGLATTRERTGQQWDAPNLWAPLQWVAVEGLARYREDALAERIATGFLSRVQTVYAQDHKLVEKYASDPDAQAGGGGEYPLQDGFGWSNGVTRALMLRYPAPAAMPAR